jgi:hypothetical protein
VKTLPNERLEAATMNSRGTILALLRRAQIHTLFICVLSLPLQAVLILPEIGLTITKITGALLIALVLIEYPLCRRWPIPRLGVESATVLALIAAALSTTASTFPKESFSSFSVFVQYAVICYSCAHVAMQRGVMEKLPGFFACGAAVSGAGAVLAWFNVLVTPTVDALVPGSAIRRVCYGMPDANEQAMVLVFALALLIFTATQPRLRIIKFGAILLFCAGLLLTMSRTGWVCAALVLALRGLTHERRKIIVPLSLTMVLIAFIALTAEATSTGDRSIASRVLYNVQAIETAQSAGAFGHGVGTVYHVTKDFSDPLGRKVGVTVHNVPLTVWIETGWVGLLAYLWLWSCVGAVLIVSSRRARDDEDKLQMTGYCVVALSYAIFSQTMPFLQRSSLAVLLGCALGAAALVSADSTNKEALPKSG